MRVCKMLKRVFGRASKDLPTASMPVSMERDYALARNDMASQRLRSTITELLDTTHKERNRRQATSK